MKIYIAYVGRWEPDCYGYHRTKKGAVKKCIDILNKMWTDARELQIEWGRGRDREWLREDPDHPPLDHYDWGVNHLRYDTPWFVVEAEVED